MADTIESLDRQLIDECNTYLETITESVGRLPQLLDAYSRDDAYQVIADELRALESESDEHNRLIGSLLANSSVADIGLRNTRIHLNMNNIVELFQRLDDIANTAERLAEELTTIKPPYQDHYFQQFHAMVSCAITAVEALDDAMSTFIGALCSHDRTVTIAGDVQTIRMAESRCDRLRNDVIATAFADDSVTDPMIYRAFALLFDQLIDIMEDVTDQLVLISSTESWIIAEPTAIE